MTNTNILSEVKKTMARFDPPPIFRYKADEWEEWPADFDQFHIMTKVDKVKVKQDVLGVHGLMHTEPITINLRTGAKPYSMSITRQVSFPVMDKVKAELERMKSAGIIKEVIEANDWCVPMVVVVKGSGDVRICVYFKKLNHAVK